MATEGKANGYVVIDMGKKKRKDVKRLRAGTGKLVTLMEESLAELRTAGTIGDAAQTVVVVVRERPRPRLFL